MIVVLAIGFAGSALTLTVMLAISSPVSNGLSPMRYATIAEETSGGGSRPISWSTYERLRDSAPWKDPALIAYAEPTRAKMAYGQTTMDISVAGVSDGFFPRATEGLTGSDFSASWDGGRGEGEVILGASLQEKLFPSPAEALGRSIVLNGQSYRVTGVARKTFTGLWYATDAWVTPDRIFYLTFGVSQDELSRASAGPAANSSTVWKTAPIFYALAGSRNLSAKRMRQALGSLVRSQDDASYHLHVTDGLSNDPVRDQKIRAWSRLAFLLSVALIFAASFNYCGLLIAQAPRRIAEVRLKRVLGAAASRIIAENMFGPAFIVAAGFVLAASAATAGACIVKTQASSYLAINVAWPTLLGVLAMELALACILAAIVALVPAFRLMNDRGAPHLGYTSTRSKSAVFTLQGIVAVQIAFCILAGLGTTMILSAVRSMSHEVLGFDSHHLTVIPIGLALKGASVDFRTSEKRDFPMATFTRGALQHAVETLPAIRYMAAASCAPFSQPLKTIAVQRMDRVSMPSRAVRFCGATQGFFEAMGNPIVEGRGFSSGDLTGSVSEVVINRQLAQELWPGDSPLHQTVRLEQPELGLRFVAQVVGVAQDMRLSGSANTPDATVFLPLKGNIFGLSFPLYFLVKGSASPNALEMFINQQATLFMPSLAPDGSYLIDERLRSSSLEQTMRVYLAGGGAILIALIAYTGLYGVLVYFINTRRKEIALRMCFGATR